MQLKNSYYYFKSAISPEICQKIIGAGLKKINDVEKDGGSTVATTFGNQEKQAKPDAMPQGELSVSQLTVPLNDTYVRDSSVAWLNDQWLYDMFHPYVREANKNAGWNWDWDYSESFQFTVYKPSGFYSWHKDGGSDHFAKYKRYIAGLTQEPINPKGGLPDGFATDTNMVGKIRKISMTVNLNAPGEYEGGNLKFDYGMHTEKEARFHECEEIRPQGSIIVFPSFLDHCVTPITSGTRYSLVLWSLGAPWK